MKRPNLVHLLLFQGGKGAFYSGAHPQYQEGNIFFQLVKENFQYHVAWKLVIYFPYLVPPFGPSPASSRKLDGLS